MKTVLLANRLMPELSPLTDLTCAALLRVAGKPLLIHAIESIAAARLTDIVIVVSSFAEQVEKTLGDGARWGMQFTYFTAGGNENENPDDLIRRLGRRIGEDLLVVRSEILRTPIIAEFIARAASHQAERIEARIAGNPAGIVLVRSDRRESARVSIDFPDARLSPIESLREFHRANLDAAAGRFPGLIVPGRELMPGVTVGRKTHLPASAIKGRPVFVGSRCRVAADAELMSEVVVSSDVVIDRRATLRSAVIMPHTYIGELVEVADAIVAGHMLIHVDTGAVTLVTDSFLLASVRTRSLASPLRTMADSGCRDAAADIVDSAVAVGLDRFVGRRTRASDSPREIAWKSTRDDSADRIHGSSIFHLGPDPAIPSIFVFGDRGSSAAGWSRAARACSRSGAHGRLGIRSGRSPRGIARSRAIDAARGCAA